MKLLVVDDEKLTREGVIASIDKKKLGIEEIYQADDGANGLEVAKKVHPDIVLCDVRMPHMDGIEMLERIRKNQPDVVAIFMSGYSDKEYLKAAIQLKAVDYIEKPFEMKELISTLKHAIEQCRWIKLQSIAGEAKETATASLLAYRFTLPYHANRAEIDSLCQELSEYYGHDKFKYASTFIVKLREVPEDPKIIYGIYDALHGFLKSMHLHVIYTEKKSYNIVFHVYGDLEPAESTLMLVAEEINELFESLGDRYIAVGPTVKGKENIYKSYEAAVILLQNSFFTNVGTILTNETLVELKNVDARTFREAADDLVAALDEKNAPKANAALEVFDELNMSKGLLPNQIKTIYYDLFLHLYSMRKKMGLVTDLSLENQETIMDVMEKCFCFSMLQGIIKDRIKSFFDDSEDNTEENPTITLIRNYISQNYSSVDLSVKSISDYANLSTSYACTFFKNETGTTLNQYITDFRMRKAKQLLSDPRNRVGEISMSVGYSDGNYFAKSFRKYTGLSPSEYREQVIRK